MFYRIMEQKIKVVWLCHFSNAFVHERLDLQLNPLIGLVKRLANKPVNTEVPEFANWITNGIREFERFDDVELHVVSPYPYLKSTTQMFEANGVHYHFFKSEDDSLFVMFYKKVIHPSYYSYKKNCKVIAQIVNAINPDIVHLFGAEMPNYALGFLGIKSNVIKIVQLQTLVSDPIFKDNYSLSNTIYQYKLSVEQKVLKAADYIGTTAIKYRHIIKDCFKPKATLLDIGLALSEPIVKERTEKQYDFVYFASDINKAVDLAIEAFALAYKNNPHITLDIIGGYDAGFKQSLDSIIAKHGITNAITFEGKLLTHDDVLVHIRKSKFALLPLKVDLTSGTIREAMSNGLPVITTDTGKLGTQMLNQNRQSVLISPVGDHQALADNMQKLLCDKELEESLRSNAYQTRQETRSNNATIKKYVDAYKACLEYYWNKKPIPKELLGL